MTAIELLQLDVINDWQQQQQLHWTIHYIPQTPSTMDWWQQSPIPHQEVCITEDQTHSRGRQGRSWKSPVGSALALSCTWTFDKPMTELSGLSLAVGVMVQKSCHSDAVQLKWPNDLLIANKKLCGVLIDLRGDRQGPCSAVIGIGMNIRTDGLLTDVEKPTTCLASLHPDTKLLRTTMVCRLLQELQHGLQQFSEHGFAAFHPYWQQHDAMLGELITLELQSANIVGIVRGVNQHGHLLLECDGIIRAFASGEVIRVHRLQKLAQ